MTVISAQEIEVVDLLAHLEEDRPCTPWAVDCGESATWVATSIVCCNVELPLCDTHRRNVLQWIELLRMSNPTQIICKQCGAANIPVDPSPYTWRKIKGC
jgi:hypothetical protein